MTEYIDKAAAVRILEAKSDMAVCTDAQPYFMVAAKMIGLLPSADVAPVVHARWELCYEDYRQQIAGDKCSACGFEHYGYGISHYHYCPNCGAIMDESEDEE